MMSSDVHTLQINLELLVKGYRSVGLPVSAFQTEFLIYEPARMCGLHNSVVVVVDDHIIRPSQSLKYLSVTCGFIMKNSRIMIIDSVTTGLRISYAKVASLKFSLNNSSVAYLFSICFTGYLLGFANVELAI